MVPTRIKKQKMQEEVDGETRFPLGCFARTTSAKRQHDVDQEFISNANSHFGHNYQQDSHTSRPFPKSDLPAIKSHDPYSTCASKLLLILVRYIKAILSTFQSNNQVASAGWNDDDSRDSQASGQSTVIFDCLYVCIPPLIK